MKDETWPQVHLWRALKEETLDTSEVGKMHVNFKQITKGEVWVM